MRLMGNSISTREKEVIKMLKDNDVPFAFQYKTKVHKLIRHLKFDFYVDHAYFIEIDGDQHYNKNNPWFNDKIVKNDMRKNEYSLKTGIPLYRIPQYVEKITYEDLTNDKFRVKKINHYDL